MGIQDFKFNYVVLGLQLLPPFIWFIWYLMGLGVTVVLTDILKMSMGELRPHFLAVCNPDFIIFS